MAGRHPWSTLRYVELTPEVRAEVRAEVAAWVAARLDPALLERERQAATLLDGAPDGAAYADARRVVRDALGLDPDTVPHDPPPDGLPPYVADEETDRAHDSV